MKMKLGFALILAVLLVQIPAWYEDVWTQSIKKISTIIPLIEENYYKDVNLEDMAHSSIQGLLMTLDPHSYFLDTKNLSTLQEDYSGKYYGLGIQIQKHMDNLMVISPIEGTPAYRMGIQPGDIISHIEGESTKPITSFQAMQKLRGKKGTQVTITIARQGMDPMDMTITRAEIPLHSVPYAFMLDSKTGYIFVRNFGSTTTQEFLDKMQFLEGLGMERLIVDFRGNGGGTLQQSLEISDLFLAKGRRIVSIRGRQPYYTRDYDASKDNQYEQIPLIILVSPGTASAPEIVSGAVQDHDRALIVGQDSFGKGLVQTVFPLSQDTAVALTTAKYYTPSGRSIQRDYSAPEEYRLRRDIPEEDREVRFTSSGRTVLGQGGITPDYTVEAFYKPLTLLLLSRGVFFSYARKFTTKDTPMGLEMVKAGMDRSFHVDARVMSEFHSHLDTLELSFTPADFEDARGQIESELDREIHSSLFGVEAGIEIFQKNDPVVKKAMEVFPQAEKLVKGD